MKKRRSDIAKLVTAARDIWRMSRYYQEVKSQSKDPARKGFFICKECGSSREVIRIDHIEGIGQQPTCFAEFGSWLQKLFESAQQPLCQDCHAPKTARERKELSRIKKAKKLGLI